MADDGGSGTGDGVGFWLYPCWRCNHRVQTREEAYARPQLCVACFRPKDVRARPPRGSPRPRMGYEYACKRCYAAIRGTWARDDDPDSTILARVKLRLCEECFRGPRRSAPPEPPPLELPGSLARIPEAVRHHPDDRPCLHGTPAQHCAYCNPGRYPHRPWRTSGLE